MSACWVGVRGGGGGERSVCDVRTSFLSGLVSTEQNNEIGLIYDQLNTIFNVLLPSNFYRVMNDLNYTAPQCRPLAPLAVGGAPSPAPP